MSNYEWDKGMGEISGFGGDYEATCRKMVIAGLEFWDEQPEDFNPRYRGFEGIYGILTEDNEDAQALDKAIMADLKPEELPTGAMHQACVQHILAARKLGWEEYQREMRERPGDE